MKFLCPGCGKELVVSDSLAGKRGKCPGCGGSVLVPYASGPPPAHPGRQEATDQDLQGVDAAVARASPASPGPSTFGKGVEIGVGTVVFACPRCGKRYEVPEVSAGAVSTCKCGCRVTVPRVAPQATPKAIGQPRGWKWSMILGSLALAVMAAVLIYSGRKPQPQSGSSPAPGGEGERALQTEHERRFAQTSETEKTDPVQALHTYEDLATASPPHAGAQAALRRLRESLLLNGGISPEVEILAFSEAPGSDEALWKREGVLARSQRGLTLPLPPGRYTVMVRRKLTGEGHFYYKQSGGMGEGDYHVGEGGIFFHLAGGVASLSFNNTTLGKRCQECRHAFPDDLFEDVKHPRYAVGSLEGPNFELGVVIPDVEKMQGRTLPLMIEVRALQAEFR